MSLVIRPPGTTSSPPGDRVKLLKLWRARRDVVLAAKCVESSYEAGLTYDHDPDDLFDLRQAVKALREVENPTA